MELEVTFTQEEVEEILKNMVRNTVKLAEEGTYDFEVSFGIYGPFVVMMKPRKGEST